ncbi:WSC domain-containing protein [Elysia marginata]|uniref:WSC domain-containing protein n=1 Tax=Elysia marginata TaxID=1093978 RepID=A0AAV4GCL2_9GAST|nr:WSC domain-containing protein [Elysia marginata]
MNFQYQIFKLLALLGFVIVNSNGSREVKYVGCMKRTSGSHSLKEKVNLPKGVHVKSCIMHCWERRRKFAGLQNGNTCYCSPTLANVVAVAETECFKRCNLNCQQVCGSEKTLSVYQTGYRREPVFPMTKQALIKAQIGCYHMYVSTWYLCDKFPTLNTIRMTAAMCVYFCASVHNAKFSSTKSKTLCCCSDSVSGAKNDRLERCNVPCRGDSSKGMGCVGKYRNKPLVTTIQISRLPAFKRWPASTFSKADWRSPLFPAGEKFEIKDKPVAVVSWENDPSLQGLVAKRLVTQTANGSVATGGDGVVADKAVVSLAGGDQRDNALGGVGKSVAVSEVSGRAEPVASGEEEGNKLIIGAVVAAFVIITVATGFYFYVNSETDIDEEEGGRKRRKKGKKRRARRSSDSDE